jgi:hypothetical protein
MLQRDLQIIVKGIVLVVMTAVAIGYLTLALPSDRLTGTILIGNVLLLVIIGSFILAIDFSRYGDKQALRLLPQMQLALWLVGMVSIILSTDGLSWFSPNVFSWILLVILLTFTSREGLVWLWRQVASRLTHR